jgi:hypothetical protein
MFTAAESAHFDRGFLKLLLNIRDSKVDAARNDTLPLAA